MHSNAAPTGRRPGAEGRLPCGRRPLPGTSRSLTTKARITRRCCFPEHLTIRDEEVHVHVLDDPSDLSPRAQAFLRRTGTRRSLAQNRLPTDSLSMGDRSRGPTPLSRELVVRRERFGVMRNVHEPVRAPSRWTTTSAPDLPVRGARRAGAFAVSRGPRGWRWRESNPRPLAWIQDFSGRSLLRPFSAPMIAQARHGTGLSHCECRRRSRDRTLGQWPSS